MNRRQSGWGSKERKDRRGVQTASLDAMGRHRPLKGTDTMGLCSTSNQPCYRCSIFFFRLST